MKRLILTCLLVSAVFSLTANATVVGGKRMPPMAQLIAQ
jgi:hypothetical protein